MNCRHCQKELPENYSATYCPFCGGDLPPREIAKPFGSLPQETRKTNWSVFFALLLLPAVLTFVAMAADLAVVAALLGLAGSLFSGVLCARTVMASTTLSGFNRALLHVVIAVLLFGLCIFISISGCAFGANITNHRL